MLSSPQRKQIIIALVAVTAMMAGSYLYSRRLDSGTATLSDTEIDLAAFKSQNPQLKVEVDTFEKPAYLVTEISSGRFIRIPKTEIQGARIGFVACDLGQIPAPVLYPNRTITTCVEVRNDKDVLAAYYFENKDDMSVMVNFFEQNVDPDARISASGRDHTTQRERRKKFTKEFIVSYLVASGWGFVGYREEKLE